MLMSWKPFRGTSLGRWNVQISLKLSFIVIEEKNRIICDFLKIFRINVKKIKNILFLIFIKVVLTQKLGKLNSFQRRYCLCISRYVVISSMDFEFELNWANISRTISYNGHIKISLKRLNNISLRIGEQVELKNF